VTFSFRAILSKVITILKKNQNKTTIKTAAVFSWPVLKIVTAGSMVVEKVVISDNKQ
jgi:hypothetical protein